MLEERIGWSLGCAFACALTLGCGAAAKKTAEHPSTRNNGEALGSPVPAAAEANPTQEMDDPTATHFDPIYFDYDQFALQLESTATLQRIADHLRKHPGLRLTIAGHTDERGTTEYNVSLGEARALRAQDYLVRLGIDRSRIRVVSFGRERPAAGGGGEESWSRNRRAEFEFSSGPRQAAR